VSLALASPVGPDLCFVFCSPEGPSTPFGSPLLAVLDVARVVCMIVGVAVVVATPRIVQRATHWGQGCRFGALAVFCLVAIDTRLEHFGDYASPRLLVDLVGTILALVGVWSYFRCDERDSSGAARSGP
jgi:hypothetical protein